MNALISSRYSLVLAGASAGVGHDCCSRHSAPLMSTTRCDQPLRSRRCHDRIRLRHQPASPSPHKSHADQVRATCVLPARWRNSSSLAPTLNATGSKDMPGLSLVFAAGSAMVAANRTFGPVTWQTTICSCSKEWARAIGRPFVLLSRCAAGQAALACGSGLKHTRSIAPASTTGGQPAANVESEVSGELRPGLERCDDRAKVNLLVLVRLPRPPYERVAAPAILHTHSFRDVAFAQRVEEAAVGERADLVGTGRLRITVPVDRFAHAPNAEIGTATSHRPGRAHCASPVGSRLQAFAHAKFPALHRVISGRHCLRRGLPRPVRSARPARPASRCAPRSRTAGRGRRSP